MNDQWYNGEIVMQLQYGPIGTYFLEQDENGIWQSITEEEAQEKFNKGTGEMNLPGVSGYILDMTVTVRRWGTPITSG